MRTSDVILTVHADTPMQFSPVTIKAAGLAPGQRVKISSFFTDEAEVEWRAHGSYVADYSGEVDVASAPSEGGTYIGTDQAGLFWSMQPPSGTSKQFLKNATVASHKMGQPFFADPLKPRTVNFMVAAEDGNVLAQSSITLEKLIADVEAVPLRHGRLRGIIWRRRDGSQSKGAVMSLTGSSGGVEMNFAPLLASLGYDVLSLAYFAYDDLPTGICSIPMEYFAEGLSWMQREFGVRRIGVQGGSRGGELSLMLAAYFPDQVCSIIPMVPMFASSAGWDPVHGASGASWTLDGKNIPYAKSRTPSHEEMAAKGEASSTGYAASPDYLEDLDKPEVRQNCMIPIDRAKANILLISGEDDQMWPSRWGSELVVNHLRAKGYAYPFRHLVLLQAGHLTLPPNSVTTFSNAVYHPLADIFLTCGGTPSGSAHAGRVMWDAMVAHYENTLEP